MSLPQPLNGFVPRRKMPYDSVIVGLGETGRSCVRFLLERGERIAVTDTRPCPPGLAWLRECCPHVHAAPGALDVKLLTQAGRVIASPGVVLPELLSRQLRRAGVEVIGDVELFCRHASAPIVAISGTNGKSTVTALLGEMAARAGLRAPTGGNLGPPALDLLSQGEVDYYLLELSSFQLARTYSLNAHAAVVLNIDVDHLDRHGSWDRYVAAKRKVYAGDGLMVLNADDPGVCRLAQAGRRMVRYSTRDDAAELCMRRDEQGDIWLCQGRRRVIRQAELGLAGEHNAGNALACIALADSLGIAPAVVVETLRAFTGLAHRCQRVSQYRGIRWYNDSKATNIAATAAAVSSLAGRGAIVLIAGGDGKGADFSALRPVLADRVRHAVLIGRDAPRIAAGLGTQLPSTLARDMEAAVQCAGRLAKEGDIVLLSPACSSLDQYQDYRARGEAFVASVRALEGDG